MACVYPPNERDPSATGGASTCNRVWNPGIDNDMIEL